jgi:hypothetical protein
LPNRNPKPIAARLRGVKGQRLIDKVPGLRQWFIDQLQRTPKPTGPELHAALKSTGFWRKLQDLGNENGIARSTVWESWCAIEIECADKELKREIAEYFNDAGGPGRGVLEIESALTALHLKGLFAEELAAVQNGKTLDSERAEHMRKFIAAAAQLEKAKHLIGRGRREALELVRAEMKELLKTKPATLRDVLATLDEIEQRGATQ